MSISSTASTKRCPDCGVKPGVAHETGCDWARCLHTGGQRLQHEGTILERTSGHDCGRDVWTGEFPGVEDARRLGWYSYFRPDYGEGTGWQTCSADDPRGGPDLNRLLTEARWDRVTLRWELR